MEYTKYHLIGIGGIGMSGIAQLLINRNFKVSGSDVKDSKIIQDLSKQGAMINIGHSEKNITDTEVVIYSSAVTEENPEMQEAKRLNLKIIKRAQALAWLMKDKKVITVAGSHGKTTTTSLVSYLLLEANFSPTMAIGGIFKNIENNALIGDGEYFVAEADESDGSFLYYNPDYSIITNVDCEHLDYYHNFDNVKKAFFEYMNNTDGDGCLFCCGDDLNLLNLAKNYKNRCKLFGFEPHNDYVAQNISLKGLSSSFDVYYQTKFIGRFDLSLAGKHNISNSLSVIALACELKIDLSIVKKILFNFKGAGRRLDIKLKNDDYFIIDDYAHHPTEIKATLSALKNVESHRIIAVFQPHRYTRTQLLLEEFGKCFEVADKVIITDIYAASEKPIPGVTGGSIVDKIKKYFPNKDVFYIPKENITNQVSSLMQPKDIVIMLGAGDIVKLTDELVKKVKK